MIAHDIIVTFYIFSLLKYDRIFGKRLEHDTYDWGKIKSLAQHFTGGSIIGFAPEIYVRFLFLWHICGTFTAYLKLKHDIIGVI